MQRVSFDPKARRRYARRWKEFAELALGYVAGGTA
jgi:hypothetical protein